MQPVFSMLMKFSRDLEHIGDGNIKLQKKGNQVLMKLPGSTIQCNYLLPWLKGDIKYGVITDKFRIEYVNIIGRLYAEFSEDDQYLYLEVVDGEVRIYKMSVDLNQRILLNKFKLVPINSWFWTKILCI